MADDSEYVKDSILDTTKKLLNIPKEYDAFDLDVITYINGVFANLHQIGVGPNDPYEITDKKNVWSEFIGENKAISSVKSYMANKVRLNFDPPATSFGIENLKAVCQEQEWRLQVQGEDIAK